MLISKVWTLISKKCAKIFVGIILSINIKRLNRIYNFEFKVIYPIYTVTFVKFNVLKLLKMGVKNKLKNLRNLR